ncbi:Hsp33 family molecular chaperone HslO [Desulfatiferula olefinivorans]
MIKKKPAGDTLKKQLTERARDRVHTFVLKGGLFRGAFINGTRMVNEMRANFDYGILETFTAGQAYLAAGLLSSTLKGHDRLNLSIDCSGPIKGLSVDANAFGEVRGYLKQAPIPLTGPLSDFNLSRFFGSGFLTLTKYLEDMKQPYTGRVMLAHGNIAEDLAHYFVTSEQTPTVFALGIRFDTEGAVAGAGGLFLQAMPGADDALRGRLEDRIRDFPSPGSLMAEARDPETVITDFFSDYTPKCLSRERIEFFCRCTEEKISGYLFMLPLSDLAEMAENGPFPVETRCHNCGTIYRFSKGQLEDMLEKRRNA